MHIIMYSEPSANLDPSSSELLSEEYVPLFPLNSEWLAWSK